MLNPGIAHTKADRRLSRKSDGSPIRVGIVGIAGRYGRWLQRLFGEVIGCDVIGSDPTLAESPTNEEVVSASDVVIFSIPMNDADRIIRDLVHASRPEQLWIDITSIKQAPVDAMRESKAEVIGMHPMCAPTVDTWKEQTVVLCPVRWDHWYDWLKDCLTLSGARINEVGPRRHDEWMSLVQVLPHSLSLIMGAVLRNQGADVKQSLTFATPVYRLAMSSLARMLSFDPALYANIQLCNKEHALRTLRLIVQESQQLARTIEAGDIASFRESFHSSREHLGPDSLEEMAALFDSLIRIMADLARSNSIIVESHDDRPGLLHHITGILSDHGINMTSLHSYRAESGYRFQIGIEERRNSKAVQSAIRCLKEEPELRESIRVFPPEMPD